jgi:hypothetical protein
MTRDDKGRFVKGQSGNPKGRSKKEVEESYLQAFRDGVSPGDWAAIIARAVSDAKRGDPAARKFVADYLIGPAVQKQELSGPNGGPIEYAGLSDEELIAAAARVIERQGKAQ